MGDKFRILKENEVYYKNYDNPGAYIFNDDDYDEDYDYDKDDEKIAVLKAKQYAELLSTYQSDKRELIIE